MEYFAKTTKFRLLKNHILKDPLLDWYTIKDEYEPNQYYKDESSNYKDYIIRESTQYKERLLEQIIESSDLNIPIRTTPEETIIKIKNNEPLILQSEIYDKE